MRTTTRVATVSVAAAAALAAAGCGSSSSGQPSAKLPPLQAATSGFTGLYAGNALTATLTFDADPATLQALDKADGNDPTPAKVYALITGGSIVLSASTSDASFAAQQAKGAAGAKDGKVALTVNAGDTKDLVQLVLAAEQLYARADVAKIESYGALATPPQDLAGQVSAFLASPTAKQLPFLAAGAAGRWLKADLAQVISFVRSYDPSALPTAPPSGASPLSAAIGTVVDKDVTAVRAASTSKGDHLVLTANGRVLTVDLVAALKTYATSISPQAASAFSDFDPAAVPDRTVSLDEYVSGGKVSELSLSLAQFFTPAEKTAVGDEPVRLVLDLTPTATVTAPTDVTTIDVPGLIGKLGAIGSSQASGSAPASAAP